MRVTTADLSRQRASRISSVADSLDGGVGILANQTVTQGGTLAASQTVELGTVTPGEAGDTLSVTSTVSAGSDTVTLQDVGGVEEVIYTAPATVAAAGPVSISYSVTDQHDDAVAQGNATRGPSGTGRN